jgi:hypothetical protein
MDAGDVCKVTWWHVLAPAQATTEVSPLPTKRGRREWHTSSRRRQGGRRTESTPSALPKGRSCTRKWPMKAPSFERPSLELYIGFLVKSVSWSGRWAASETANSSSIGSSMMSRPTSVAFGYGVSINGSSPERHHMWHVSLAPSSSLHSPAILDAYPMSTSSADTPSGAQHSSSWVQ